MKKFSLLIFVLWTALACAQHKNSLIVVGQEKQQKQWVDSIYNKMSLEEKIGQLYMVDIFSQAPKASTDRIKTLINENHIGGIIFSKGGPVRQAILNNEYQDLAKVPLLIGMDAEWGLAMRLDSTFAYPWNMTLGAVNDNKLIEQAGAQIGKHAKRLGVHINFAPSVDVNNNPKNPIIGNRSFGEDPIEVTAKATAFIKGMEGVGTSSSIKHFPGHGNTDQDSHLGLPLISGSRADLDKIELYPYKQILNKNITSAVMTSHLHVPAIDNTPKMPSSLSYKTITGVLKDEYNFEGLIYTDALNMKGATQGLQPGEADLKAFLAGTDILLIPQNIIASQKLFLEAYNKGELSEERLAHSVKKILMAKYKAGLNNFKAVEIKHLYEDLNTPQDHQLYKQLMEEAVTLVKNKENAIPFTEIKNKKFAYIALGDDADTNFLPTLKDYSNVKQIKANDVASYKSQAQEFTDLIVVLHKKNNNPWQSYKFSKSEINIVQELAKSHKVHLVVFTSPYSLLDLDLSDLESILVAYQNHPSTQQIAAQILFGTLAAKGSLPVGISEEYPVGHGIYTDPQARLGFSSPEDAGLNSKVLNKIDNLVNQGLKQKMMPGAQVLVARDGKVVYHKSFGRHEYTSSSKKVGNTDVYDLASLTKILATLPLIMELIDKEVISLETKISELLPEYKGNEKGNIKLIDLLTHFNRLKAWIPFYRYTLDKQTSKPDNKYYQTRKSDKFNLQVAQDLYMRTDYRDSIFKTIKDSELRAKQSYRYSDLPYYLLQKYLEEYYNKPLNQIVEERFYSKMGTGLTYLPLEKYTIDQIPPTENDNYFRYQKVQGYVHDQGAAMMGGVAGHAGLFGNTLDIAMMMQMFLNEGSYAGLEFISEDTFRMFNTCYYCDKYVRRGVGFDKPQLGNVGPTCGCVSMTSFGHSGFTGTFAWADPEERIIYVFLSNRTFPDAENNSIIKNNLRSNIQQIIYEAIEESFIN